MPSRASATSFGGKQANPINKAGRPAGYSPEVFERRMRFLAQKGAEAKRLESLLADENPDDDKFFKAFDRVTDRGFGKPNQSVSGPGGGDLVIRIVRDDA
jgi:hypothetical protein